MSDVVFEGMKRCPLCHTDKPLSEYGKRRGKYPQSRCKACSRTETKTRMDEHRKRLSDIKLRTGCADCGYKEHPAALDFDHLPEYTKSFTIGECISYRWSRLEDEIGKCEVVCANCHRVRTYDRRSI